VEASPSPNFPTGARLAVRAKVGRLSLYRLRDGESGRSAIEERAASGRILPELVEGSTKLKRNSSVLDGEIRSSGQGKLSSMTC